MTSLVIGILFLCCLFFSPLATSLPKEIDGAALIYISTLFVRNIVDIECKEEKEKCMPSTKYEKVVRVVEEVRIFARRVIQGQ